MTILRGNSIENAPLSQYTSWRVGGPAKHLYKPYDLADLCVFLKQLHPYEPITFLGLGSNTLVRDGGIDHTVIITQAGLNHINFLSEEVLRAESGVACPTFARFCARQGLRGGEFLAGIPGTLGGALVMNAGCHGGEIWKITQAVETVNRGGEVKIRYPDEYDIHYRHTQNFFEEWFVAGHFTLKTGSKEDSLNEIRALLAHRSASQPTNEPNSGSVFRNPNNDYAARLIEAAGLKGKQIGGAVVSTKHANFIINDGTATAQDIETLIEWVVQKVSETFHVSLVREVHIIGHP